MHPNTVDIWYAKSGGNVRNYHSKRNAPNTRHLWVDKTTSKGPQKKKSVARNTPTGTIWATKRKNAAHIIVWATKFFVAHTRSFNVAFNFSTPNLWASSVGRRNHFRRPLWRTSKMCDWASISFVAQNAFSCSGPFVPFGVTFSIV